MSKENTPSGPERSLEEMAKVVNVAIGYCDIYLSEGRLDYNSMKQSLITVQNFLSTLAAAPQPKDTSGMQWIKANERLPDKSGKENSVVIKSVNPEISFTTSGFKNFDEKNPQLYFTLGNRSYLTTKNRMADYGNLFPIDELEWLDESAPLLSTQQGERGCNICGGELVLIRGKYPKEDKRKVCPTCNTERLEQINEISSKSYGVAFQENKTPINL